MFKIARPKACRLSSSAYRSTVEYSRILALYEAQHKLLGKSHNLYQETQGCLTQDQQERFESIDQVKSEGMLHAEKKCCPLKMGEVDFSPDVNTAKGRCLVWQMIIRKRRGNRVSSKKIRCIAKAVGIVGNPLSNTITLREAKCCFKAADEEYWQLKLQAPMKREEFLRDRSRDEALTLAVRKRAKQALVHERQRDNA
jgi:hypothetical protein